MLVLPERVLALESHAAVIQMSRWNHLHFALIFNILRKSGRSNTGYSRVEQPSIPARPWPGPRDGALGMQLLRVCTGTEEHRQLLKTSVLTSVAIVMSLREPRF